MSTARKAGRVTVGVVGAGAIVVGHHLPVLVERRDVHVAYVADVSPRALRRACRRFGVPGILLSSGVPGLPDTEVVLLATPLGARRPYYEQVTARSTRLYVEKPLAASTPDAVEIARLIPSSRLVCGYQRRLYANVALIEQTIRDRRFGALRRITIREGARTTATGTAGDFRDDVALSGGGILMDLGCHAVDLVHVLTGAPAGEVLDAQLLFDGDVDRDAILRLRLAAASGPVEARIELSWLRDLPGEVCAEFDRCTLRTSTRPEGGVMRTAHDGSPPDVVEAPDGARTPWDAFDQAWSALLDPGRQRPAALSLESALPGIAVIEQVYGAARARRA